VKIYVCEVGCKYEGGSAFFASTNYLKAWKKIREKRLKENQMLRLIDKDKWEGEFEYFVIRVFED